MPDDPRPWRQHAACHGEDPELFYPEQNQRHPDYVPPIVAAICGACPVKADCLGWGIQHEALGVWGGSSPAWRHRLRQAAGITLNTPQIRTRGRDDWADDLGDDADDFEEEEELDRWAL